MRQRVLDNRPGSSRSLLSVWEPNSWLRLLLQMIVRVVHVYAIRMRRYSRDDPYCVGFMLSSIYACKVVKTLSVLCLSVARTESVSCVGRVLSICTHRRACSPAAHSFR